MLKALALVAALALATPTLAAGPRDKMLVTPAWLSSHLTDKNLIVLHAGENADYQAGHIEGARLITQNGLATTGPGGLVLELPAAADLQKQLQDLGVSNNSRIVVYHNRDLQAATRIVFTLTAAGLGDRVSLLDGGLAEWKRAGKPVTDKAPTVRPGVLSPLKIKPHIVDAEFVRAHLGAPGYVVADARAPVFYDGLQAGMGANKRGHLPGAKSIPFTSVAGADLKLKPAEELAAAFKTAGLKQGDHLVVYCHVGQQATAVVFAARTLGYDAVLYDGSFQDWSMRNLPVEGPAAK